MTLLGVLERGPETRVDPSGPVRRLSALCDDRTSWLAARRSFITASDAAKILGLSKFGGPMDVWLDKTSPELPPESPHLEAGRRFERAILEWFADLQGAPVHFANPFEIYVHPTHDRVGATLDALRLDGAVPTPVDAKLIARPQPGEWGEPGTSDMPLYYGVQLVIQMAVTNAPFAELAVWFPSNEVVPYRLYRDPETEASILAQCQAFYVDHVLGNIAPPVDGSESYARYLKTRVRQATDLLLDGEAHQATVAALLETRSKIAALEAEALGYENLLKAAIGEAAGLQIKGYRVSWKKDRDSMGPDYESIALRLACDAARESLRREMPEDLTPDDIKKLDDAAERLGTETFDRLKKASAYQVVTRTGPRKFVVKPDSK